VADAEQPQPSLPRVYVNWAAGQGTALELAVTLGYKEGEAAPTVSAPIVVAWEFVPVLIKLLEAQLEDYQGKMGNVRQVLEDEKEEAS
jgi:hypothetical protein